MTAGLSGHLEAEPAMREMKGQGSIRGPLRRRRSFPCGPAGVLALAVLVASLAAWGQTGTPPSPEPPAAYSSGVPGSVTVHLRALGNRTQIAGREQTVYDGTWTNSSGSSSTVRLIHQLPSLIRLEGVGGTGSVLAFDGSQVRSKAAVLLADEQLMETFVHDTQEGFLHAVAAGGFRVIGYGYGAGAGTSVKYDVIEVAVPVETASGNPLRIKWFYFDAASGRLAKTTYQDDRGTTVEVRFSSWGEVSGSYYPGTIERFEAGTRIFALMTGTLSVGPASTTTVFQDPNATFSLDGETP